MRAHYNAGTFCFLQEVIGSNASGLPPPQIPKDADPLTKALARARIDSKAIKMALYGFFVSAPVGHFLVGMLQKAFAGKTGLKARLGQLLASNLLISPINAVVFLASMAIINGAKSVDEVIRTVKGGFFSVLRVSWVVSPLSMTVAQQFIPVELWVPFFNTIQFMVGTFMNIKMKKMRLAAARKEAEERQARESESGQGRKTLITLSCIHITHVNHTRTVWLYP
ncbi:uncharacterized protein EDB93DRAFT_9524 [Suillus bovinus]|uniref:uncharacterized protein n=1 Tax=Suillus bovinus TaxID=48563 RepID=UPI001B87AECA|nr:uncharacterized protein EDB93DRAFT_9524 [Suillus bovinus]KAG2159715.1 hypothetical protein EDB93DRAFT_9524 [Suillus bovinus]